MRLKSQQCVSEYMTRNRFHQQNDATVTGDAPASDDAHIALGDFLSQPNLVLSRIAENGDGELSHIAGFGGVQFVISECGDRQSIPELATYSPLIRRWTSRKGKAEVRSRLCELEERMLTPAFAVFFQPAPTMGATLRDCGRWDPFRNFSTRPSTPTPTYLGACRRLDVRRVANYDENQP